MIWIRSQCKGHLVEVTGILYVKENDVFEIRGYEASCGVSKDDYWWLGEYSTKEKALKVLDMIQNYIRQCKIDDTVKHIVRRVPLDNITFQKTSYVFQMPKDDEVKA